MTITKKQRPRGSKVQAGKSLKVGMTLEDKFDAALRKWLSDNGYRRCDALIPILQAAIIPDRKFRWDFAWMEHKLAVEINGGQFMIRGGHSSIAGTNRDAEKGRMAAAAGWRVLTFTGDDIKHGRGFDELASCLGLTAELQR